MILALILFGVFSNVDIRETYTTDIKLTTTYNVEYSFKRISEYRSKIYNVYPDYFTNHDKRICEEYEYISNIQGQLECSYTDDWN